MTESNTENEGWCWSCGDEARGDSEAPIVTRLRERVDTYEGALDRVEALARRWETTPALRRRTAASELRSALAGF